MTVRSVLFILLALHLALAALARLLIFEFNIVVVVVLVWILDGMARHLVEWVTMSMGCRSRAREG